MITYYEASSSANLLAFPAHDLAWMGLQENRRAVMRELNRPLANEPFMGNGIYLNLKG